MIKVVYDYQIFSLTRYGGIARYIYEVASRIMAMPEFEVDILAGIYINQYLNPLKAQQQPRSLKGWQLPLPRPLQSHSRLNRLLLQTIGQVDATLSHWWLHHDTADRSPDIVHETYYRRDRLAPPQSRIVVTVHDMIHEKFQFDPALQQSKVAAIRRADHIICVSESTKRDLLNLVDGIDPNQVSVIHLSCSLDRQPQIDSTNPPIDRPYILYVGDRDRYKNFQRLLAAYANCAIVRQHFSLVCFGVSPFHRRELALFSKYNLNEQEVRHVTGNDATLANLYAHAAAFVYPSLYEGFGLPPLEAMKLDCPVICSNVSSIPEVVGNAGQYFDPTDSDSMAEALEKVLFSTSRTEELIALGRQRVQQFSWAACADKTQQVYAALC